MDDKSLARCFIPNAARKLVAPTYYSTFDFAVMDSLALLIEVQHHVAFCGASGGNNIVFTASSVSLTVTAGNSLSNAE